jgi:IS30 family transposase
LTNNPLTDKKRPTACSANTLSKSSDLRRFDQTALDAIATELNGRPRQTLGFKTPSQALAETLR